MKFKLLALILLLLSFPVISSGLTLDEEKKYGKEIYLEIARAAPVNNDPYISLYVKGIKDRLEGNANLPFPAVLTVIDSQTADAFATVGGYVFITTGLIAMCEKEEELAGVIAHEFAHVYKRHIAKRLEKEKYINIASIATMLAAILIPDAGAKGAILTTGMGSAQALALKYSREDEYEADSVGSVIADKAGYGGLGSADFLRKLRSGGGDKILPQYLLTHPYHEERVIRLENMWTRKKIDLDTSFFPFITVRTQILYKDARSSSDEVWINRYQKDRNDPASVYGASLVYAIKGNAEKSVNVVMEMDSSYKNMFLGEMLVDAHHFKEAIEVLKHETHPASKFYLARAYEGAGDRLAAIEVFGEISQYGDIYPEIYYRYGMLLGRMGQEASGYEYLGRFYLETGRLDLARANFEKAIARYGINSKEGQNLMRTLDEMKGEAQRSKK